MSLLLDAGIKTALACPPGITTFIYSFENVTPLTQKLKHGEHRNTQEGDPESLPFSFFRNVEQKVEYLKVSMDSLK
jgi:hypothetical protein